MKRLYRVTMLAIIATMTSLTASAGFNFGVRLGLNVNELHLNKKTFDASNRGGFTGGFMAEFEVPIIGICVDASLMYTRMNSEIDRYVTEGENGTTVSIDKDRNVGKNFLEIPVNLKYKLSIPAVSNIIRPYIFTGPSFAFKLDKHTFNSMKTRTCQVAWNVGLGIELIKHLQIGASYGFGMNNIAKHWVDAQNIKVKNNYWTVTAAWLF